MPTPEHPKEKILASAIQVLKTPADERLWVLETKNTAYAFRLNEHNHLENLYWGEKLAYPADYFPRELNFDPLGNWNFARNTHEEFPVWGEYKFNEPCLKVEFSDGVRAGLFDYIDSTIAGDGSVATLTVHLQDRHYPLKLRLIYKVFVEHDVIERSAEVENIGGEPIQIDQILSAAWHLPRRESYQLTSLSGKWGGEFQV